MDKIYLASSSPRRKEILRSLGVPFVAIHPDIDESTCDRLVPEFRVVALAEKKALAGESMLRAGAVPEAGPDAGPDAAKQDSAPDAGPGAEPRLLLASDTLVAFHLPKAWKTIGKPRDKDDAREMLRYLSGKTHTVFTGLCLLDLRSGARRSVCAKSSVRFARMSEAEIEGYLDAEEWRGAAGAYRVQGRGSCFIETLNGSWSCVMGLPIRELYGILRDAGYDFGDSGRTSLH